MSTRKYEIPSRPDPAPPVRASRMPQSANWAKDVQTFWPFTTYSSPSRSARVMSEGRSDPAAGSLKSWHHSASPRSIGAEVIVLLRRACPRP